MAEFLSAYTKTLAVEGGYVNRKSDRGGETFYGVSRNFHPDCPIWDMIDKHFEEGGSKDTISRIPGILAVIARFYKEKFWTPLLLDDFKSQQMAEEVFDSAVNCGHGNAIKFLQKALNRVCRSSLLVDGAMGPKTLYAVNSCPSRRVTPLLKAANGYQFMHYDAIAENDPTQIVYFAGWMRRVWFPEEE